MPDRDVFSRYAAPGWRAPLKCFYGSADANVFARATLRAIGTTLRQRGGLPALEELSAIVREHDEGRTTARQALERVRALQTAHGFDRHVRIAAATVARMVTEGYSGGGAYPDPCHELARRFVCDLISHHVFERGGPELMVQRFGEDQALRASFERQCWDVLEAGRCLDKIASQLVRDPSGKRMRISYPPAPRMTTGDWLSQPVA